MGIVDDLHRAREAYERREWVAAYRALSDLDEAEFRGEDFAALATTAYLLGRRNDAVQALQRAYAAHLGEGDVPAAVRSAYWLITTLWSGGEFAIGSGWLTRAQRLLDEYGEDVVERGYLLDRVALAHVIQGQFAEAIATAPQALEYGRRHRDPDLTAAALNMQGRLMLYAGQVGQGLRLLDEAMVAVLAGEVSPVMSGIVYCSSIEACQEISDLARAAEWTHALSTWCRQQPGLLAYTGQCAVHRGQLMRLHGAFGDAIQEFERAAVRYAEAGGSPAVGQAHYERGETLRLQGQYDAAEAAFDTASQFGHSAQPGRALLWLAGGRTEAAVGAVHRLLTERQAPVQRVQVLGPAVEVLLASGDRAQAAPFAEELRALGAEFGCRALRAAGLYADAAVAMAGEDGERALDSARRAADIWAELSATYETARSRALVGRALRMLGDDESAEAELRTARRTLAEIGARPAEQEVAAMLGHQELPAGLTPREVEVLRLVAVGNSNPEIAAALVLSEKTVARHLSNIFTKLDVPSRTAAAAFAYAHHLV